MIARLARRQSRMLALLLFIVVLVLLLAATALPAIVVNNHYDVLIDEMGKQLATYQRVARHSEQYRSEYRQLQHLQQRDRRYLQSGSESLATAELQRIAKQIITGNQGEILSTQVMQTGEEQGFKRVKIRIRMKSRLEEMVKIFHALESQKPYLFLENISVRSRQMSRRRLPSNKAIEEAMSQLDIDFQLFGYMRASQS